MPGTNNFKVFDENLQNIMPDVEYNTDTQRLNGVAPGIARTQLHNKLFRQVSIMVAALAQFVANQGQNASDSDLATLTTAITNAIAAPLSTHAAISGTSAQKGHLQLATTSEATTGTDTAKAVTPAGVKAALNALINAAPGTLDTLAEIATALGNDPNFAATITNLIAGKASNSITITANGGLSGGGDLTANRTISITAGGVSDSHLGNRTIDEAIASPAASDTMALTNLLSYIGKTLKAITGKTNWYDIPATSIETLNTDKVAKPESFTPGKLLTLDANGDLINVEAIVNLLKPVVPGDNVLYTHPSNITIASSNEKMILVFNVVRPGKYRVTGNMRNGSGTIHNQIKLLLPGYVIANYNLDNALNASNEFDTMSLTDVPFVLDMTVNAPSGGCIGIHVSTAGTSSVISNIQLKYADLVGDLAFQAIVP